MARILIVEDEATLREVLSDILEEEGHRVLVASNGDSGLERIFQDRPDLILLDVMLPKMDGFDVCRIARQRGVAAPVLMLTAKGRIEDRVVGLDSGADDYLVKPFSTRELLARVRALLRRVESNRCMALQFLQLGDMRIDFVRMEARRKSKRIDFTAREFAMMRLLAEKIGEPVSRQEFLDRVWEYHAFPTTRTVDNHVVKLRAKVERDPQAPLWIHTVHGIGYRLDSAAGLTHRELPDDVGKITKP
jgi:DNA-binding response OmpR family regulator